MVHSRKHRLNAPVRKTMGGASQKSRSGYCLSPFYPHKVVIGNTTYCYNSEAEAAEAEAKAKAAEANAEAKAKAAIIRGNLGKPIYDAIANTQRRNARRLSSSELNELRKSTNDLKDSRRSLPSFSEMSDDARVVNESMDPSNWKDLFVVPKLQEIPAKLGEELQNLEKDFETCAIMDKNDVIYSIPETIDKSDKNTQEDMYNELAGNQFFTILFNHNDRPKINTISIRLKGDQLESNAYIGTTYEYNENETTQKTIDLKPRTVFPVIKKNPLQIAYALRVHSENKLLPENLLPEKLLHEDYMYLATKFTNYYSRCTCDGIEIYVNNKYTLEKKTIEVKEISQTFELQNGQISRKIYVNYTECIDKIKETKRDDKKTNQTIQQELKTAYNAYLYNPNDTTTRNTYFKILTETKHQLTKEDIANFNSVMKNTEILSENNQKQAPLPVNQYLPNKGLQVNGIYKLSKVCPNGEVNANCGLDFYMTVVRIQDDLIEYNLNVYYEPYGPLRQIDILLSNINEMHVSRCDSIPTFGYTPVFLDIIPNAMPARDENHDGGKSRRRKRSHKRHTKRRHR